MTGSTWITDLWAWRAVVENAPKPFTTPPLADSALYLVEEAGELLAAVHATLRPGDLRNPASERAAVEDEIGDVLMMLGTVAMQTDTTMLHYRATHFATAKRVCVCIQFAIDAIAYIEAGDGSKWLAAKLDAIYSLVVDTAREFDVDMEQALRGTMRKIETRSGL